MTKEIIKVEDDRDVKIKQYKRKIYVNGVISRSFEKYKGEIINENFTNVLKMEIESRYNHNDEFKVKFKSGKIFVYHLNEEIVNF